MALQSIQHEAAAGSDYAARLVLRDGDGAAITTWTGAAVLAARAWPGGAYATAFTPTATWLDAAAGSLRLDVAGTATAAVTPGLYQLALGVDGGPWNNLGTMRITPGAGTDAAPATYCTLRDMTALCPWIEAVEDLGPGLAAGLATNFQDVRAQARRWLDDQILARADSALGYQQRLVGPTGLGVGTQISGYDSGPYFGPSTLPDTSLGTQTAAIRAALDADGLLLDDAPGSGRSARRIAASYALYLALRHQPGGLGENGMTYRALAMDFRNDAIRLMQGWRAMVGTAQAIVYSL